MYIYIHTQYITILRLHSSILQMALTKHTKSSLCRISEIKMLLAFVSRALSSCQILKWRDRSKESSKRNTFILCKSMNIPYLSKHVGRLMLLIRKPPIKSVKDKQGWNCHWEKSHWSESYSYRVCHFIHISKIRHKLINVVGFKFHNHRILC